MDTKKRLTIFAHWDKDNIVDPYVLFYLRELSKISDVVFVSDGDISDTNLVEVRKICKKAIAVRHGEYDFGSYKRGFLDQKDELEKYDELLFVNDSCYGPFYDLSEIFDIVNPEHKLDFWGLFNYIPDGKKYPPIAHVQSYFIVFSKKVFESEIFNNFILSIKKEDEKKNIIRKYEIGLSEILTKNGFTSGTLCSGDKMFISNRDIENYIKDYNFPLLKKEILFKNPFRIVNLIELLSDIKKTVRPKYDFTLIENNYIRNNVSNNLEKMFIPFKIDFIILNKNFFRIKSYNIKYIYLLKIKFFMAFKIYIPFYFNYKHYKYIKDKNRNEYLFKAMKK